MKNLFIDSNIWLSLYHFTKNDLSEFSKLKEILGKDIKLFFPEQVRDEIFRNRDAKLKDALKDFQINKITFPVFCKEYPEYEEIKKAIDEIIVKHKLWKNKIFDDIAERNLPADNTIREFIDSVDIIPCKDYISKGYTRFQIGNPPGKDNKYGDAINWECLLDVVPNGEDLYIISDDKDYKSAQENTRFNLFLSLEWQTKKQSEIHFYSSLVDFLNKHFKEIKLQEEQEKQSLIDQLTNSTSFQNTHGIIAMLSKHSGWTESQIEQMCLAAEENEQVNRILSDNDIFLFYSNLLSHLDYDQLEDSATKRVMYIYYGDAIEGDNYEEDYDEDEYPTDMFG